MRPAFVLAVALVACMSQIAQGQRLSEISIGSRVRLDMADGALVTGTLVSLDADTLRLASGGGVATLSFPRATVVSYEVSAGRERRRGAVRGAIAGGAIGLALVVATLRNDTASVNRHPSDVGLAVSVGVALAVLGAGIGAALAPEQWEAPRRVAARHCVVTFAGRCVALGFRLQRR